jgi:hypothetical protein
MQGNKRKDSQLLNTMSKSLLLLLLLLLLLFT